jgi:glutathione S-transferase
MHVAQFFLPDAPKSVHRDYRRRWLERGLDELLPFLFRDSSLAVGTSLSLADFFVMPIFAKAVELGVSVEARPSYVAHLAACLGDPAVRAACPLSLPSVLSHVTDPLHALEVA